MVRWRSWAYRLVPPSTIFLLCVTLCESTTYGPTGSGKPGSTFRPAVGSSTGRGGKVTRSAPFYHWGFTIPGMRICVFPDSWQQGKQWWRGYVSKSRQPRENYLNYRYEVFGSDIIQSFERLTANSIQETFRCVSSSRRGSTFVFVVRSDKGHYDCREYAEVGGVLLIRWLFSGSTSGRAPTPAECEQKLADLTLFEVLSLFSLATNEVTVHKCPMSSGVYRTEIVEQREQGPVSLCKQNPDSYTTIKGGTIDIQSCQKTDTFSKPYFSYMYCVADWDGDAFGTSFRPKAASDRSVLLFYQNTEEGGRPQFLTGVYRREAGSVVKLNLYIGDEMSASGDLSAHADSRSHDYRQFILTRERSVPEGSTPRSQVTNYNSVNCGGVCLNGVCQERSGRWQCVCKKGFGGTRCETVLAVGSCEDKPCKEGECEQKDPGYYYCRCKEGYTGLNCEVPQYCLPNPCVRGKCELYQGGHRCLCDDGYTGVACRENVVAEMEANHNILIILSTLLSVFVVAVVVVAVLICQCRRKREEKKVPLNPDGDLPNQTYSSMTSWFPDYQRQLAAKEETVANP